MKLRQRHSCGAVYDIIASTDVKNTTTTGCELQLEPRLRSQSSTVQKHNNSHHRIRTPVEQLVSINPSPPNKRALKSHINHKSRNKG